MELSKFKSIPDLLKAFPTKQDCLDYLTEIRWNGNVISPFDPASRVYKCKLNRYKCKNTNKYFNAKTGTIFEDTKIPLQKWFIANYLFSSHKKGISSYQLGRDIDVSQKTAWFMLHRLRVAFGVKTPRLEGMIEIDESYIGGESYNKHESKKKLSPKGQSIHQKAEVMGILERKGKIIVKATESKPEIIKHIKRNVKKGSILFTDQAQHFKNLDQLPQKYRHYSTNHESKEFVSRLFIHTNGLENFWSHLKRGINGIYHHISVKHLQAYLDEYTLRFNTRQSTTSARFDVVLKNMVHRLKYHDLISNEKKAA